MEAAANASFEKWRARQQESLGWVPQADRSPATIKVKPMKRTIAHTDATEHANDHNRAAWKRCYRARSYN